MQFRISTVLVLAMFLTACSASRPIRPADIRVPDGYRVEEVARGLAAPTMVAFDDQNRMLIAESAYGGGGEPKVTRVERDGRRTVLARGDAFGTELPVTAVAFHDGQVYVAHAGTISIIEPDGRLRNIIAGLPGQGDHQTNQMVFRDGRLYFTVGTVTNAAVVGVDNAVFGWLKNPALRQLHDVPCRDVTLADPVFESDNPLEAGTQVVRTSAYAPFGTTHPAGTIVPGNPKCNGAVLRANLDGSNLEVVAWGLRNPYGLAVGPDGALYVTMHGFDARGSRQIENAWDCVYRIEEGRWYGWPDFACDVPVTDPRFKPRFSPQPRFVLANHFGAPPAPIAKFDPHAATNGFAFAPNEQWGKPTEVFIALFGDFVPATGTAPAPKGVRIVRLDTANGTVSDFMANKSAVEASKRSSGGLEHPSDVTFGPDGAMYVTDWGIARVTVDGLRLDPNTGVVWRVTPASGERSFPVGPSFFYVVLGIAVLGGLTALTLGGPGRGASVVAGLRNGALAGLVMGVAAMIVAVAILRLPWYAPGRVFAIPILGRAAVADILAFHATPFFVGLVVLLAMTALLGGLFALLLRAIDPTRITLAGVFYGLTAWAILHYAVFPALFPLISDKGFPPFWYAMAFAIYGWVLGALMAGRGRRRPRARVDRSEQRERREQT